MDELTEEEVTCLRASSRPWYKLPDNCKHDGLPLYIKLCTDMNEQKNGLIVLLTDIRSSVWMEYFGESRTIHIRIKVSARETPKSTYTDLKEKEAVAKLFEGLDTYSNTLDADASIESKSESEMEVALQLDGLSFRLRLDVVSPALQSRLLYDLIYLPLLGVVNAVQHGTQECLSSLQHAIDQESKNDSPSADPEVLSAMQRFSQGTTGVSVKMRTDIQTLVQTKIASTSMTSATTSRSSPMKPSSKSKSPRKEQAAAVEADEDDADKTMLSSPEPDARQTRSGSTIKGKTASPSPAKHTRAASCAISSLSPSPPLSTKSKNNGKARHIAESSDEAGGDSDATQESETEAMQVDEVPPPKSKSKKVAKERSPPPKRETRRKSPSPVSPPPSPPKTRKKTPSPDSEAPTQSSPQAPVLKRPAAGTRGLPPKRGKRPGLQWSNFG